MFLVKYNSSDAIRGLTSSSAPHHLPNKLSESSPASFLWPQFPSCCLEFSTVLGPVCALHLLTLVSPAWPLIIPHGSPRSLFCSPPTLRRSAGLPEFYWNNFFSCLQYARWSSLRTGAEAYLLLYTLSLASIWKILIESLLCGYRVTGWGCGAEQGSRHLHFMAQTVYF